MGKKPQFGGKSKGKNDRNRKQWNKSKPKQQKLPEDYDDDGFDFEEEDNFNPADEDLDIHDDTELDRLYGEHGNEFEGQDIDEEDFKRLNENGELDLESENEDGDAPDDDHELDGDDMDEEDAPREKVTITSERLDTIFESISNSHSLNAVRFFLKIFRQAISTDEDEEEDGKKGKKPLPRVIYELEDAQTFNNLITFAMQGLPPILKAMSKKTKEDSVGQRRKLLILFNVYFSNYIKFIQKPHEKDTLVFILANTAEIVQLVFPLKIYLRKLQKLFIDIWSTHESNIVKLKCFVGIREIAVQHKESQQVETIFRKVYMSFIKQTKQLSWMNYEQLTFMSNCCAELFELNKDSAYVVGFGFIREMGLHLKKCIKERKGNKAHKLYNWQFLQSLKLWLKVVSYNSGDSEMGKLAYPLVEIAIGALNFMPGIKFAPFRLHVISYLNEFSFKSGIYIPTLPYLLEMLSQIDLNKKRDPKSSKATEFPITIKVQKSILKLDRYYKDVFGKIVNTLYESLANVAGCLALPEITLQSRIALKKYMRGLRSKESKEVLRKVLAHLDENIAIIEKERERVDFKNYDNLEKGADLPRELLKTLSLRKINRKLKRQAEEKIKQNIVGIRE